MLRASQLEDYLGSRMPFLLAEEMIAPCALVRTVDSSWCVSVGGAPNFKRKELSENKFLLIESAMEGLSS